MRLRKADLRELEISLNYTALKLRMRPCLVHRRQIYQSPSYGTATFLCFLEHITNSSNSAEGNETQALGSLRRSFPVSRGAIRKVSLPLIRPFLASHAASGLCMSLPATGSFVPVLYGREPEVAPWLEGVKSIVVSESGLGLLVGAGRAGPEVLTERRVFPGLGCSPAGLPRGSWLFSLPGN